MRKKTSSADADVVAAVNFLKRGQGDELAKAVAWVKEDLDVRKLTLIQALRQLLGSFGAVMQLTPLLSKSILLLIQEDEWMKKVAEELLRSA